jgi:hypothetical protein
VEAVLLEDWPQPARRVIVIAAAMKTAVYLADFLIIS